MNRSLVWIAQRLLIATVAGCGGGGDDVIALHAMPASVVKPAPVTTVQLEGCVVDDYFQPRSQTPVRALGADGRLLGNAQSDARGVFKLELPVGQNVSLAIDRPDGDVMKVVSGLHGRALTTCLVDPSA